MICSVQLYPAFHAPLRERKKMDKQPTCQSCCYWWYLETNFAISKAENLSRSQQETHTEPTRAPTNPAKAHLPHSPLCQRGPQPQVKPHDPERGCGAAQQVVEIGFSPHWLLPFPWNPFPCVISVHFQWCIVMPVYINSYRRNHKSLASWCWWGPGLNSTHSHT